jgi:hypothetical protein
MAGTGVLDAEPTPVLGTRAPLDEGGPTTPLEHIWSRLARPFSTPETVEAVLGLPPKVVRQYAGALTATSEEAVALVDAMPRAIRSLATSMEANAVRCRGELRGPILWSETMSARASSNGDEDLFVCAAPGRAYDITENRVLVAALDSIRNASDEAQAISEDAYDDVHLRWARRMGDRAKSYLNHPSLRSVARERPSGRAIKRTRSGKSHKTYQPALEMLERADHPLGPRTLAGFVDQRTRAQHAVLMGLVDALESGGSRLPDFRAENGALYAGPLQYHHPRKRGSTTRVSGILLGTLLIDVPDRLREVNRARAEEEIQARAQGRPTFVVMEALDIERAVGAAVNLARG